MGAGEKGRPAVTALPPLETFADIRVVGVGGGGCNAVTRMVQTEVRGVEFIAMNTDAQALSRTAANQRIHIGETRGSDGLERRELMT